MRGFFNPFDMRPEQVATAVRSYVWIADNFEPTDENIAAVRIGIAAMPPSMIKGFWKALPEGRRNLFLEMAMRSLDPLPFQRFYAATVGLSEDALLTRIRDLEKVNESLLARCAELSTKLEAADRKLYAVATALDMP